MMQCFLRTRARPVSGLRDISTAEKIAGSLALSRGHPWPMLHRTRLDVPWHIPEDNALRYAAMEASRCWDWAIC